MIIAVETPFLRRWHVIPHVARVLLSSVLVLDLFLYVMMTFQEQRSCTKLGPWLWQHLRSENADGSLSHRLGHLFENVVLFLSRSPVIADAPGQPMAHLH